MPSTQTITAFYSFSPGSTIRSSEVNYNFSIFRGHIIPVDPTTSAAATTRTYDFGASDHAWRYTYTQQLNLYADTAGATPPAGYYAVYVKSGDGKAYKKDSSGNETQLGGGALIATGTPAAPLTITAAGGVAITQSSGERQVFYIVGDTTAGTDITANPQISGLTTTSYNIEIWFAGTSDTYVVIFDDGNGMALNGQAVLGDKSILKTLWNGSVLVESGRVRC